MGKRTPRQAADAMEAPFGPYFKMLLLSGQRRVEVACMTWGELDLNDAQVWIIPAARMKAKRPHEVPLSTSMVKMLQAMNKERGKGDYVFSTTGGKRPISGYSKAKAALNAKVAELRAVENGGKPPKGALPDWRIHDLRRTVRTGLGALSNVPHDIRELVVSHVPTTLVRTYDLHGYRDEKRQALELWSQRLKQIVEPPTKGKSNVVSLPARKAARAKESTTPVRPMASRQRTPTNSTPIFSPSFAAEWLAPGRPGGSGLRFRVASRALGWADWRAGGRASVTLAR